MSDEGSTVGGEGSTVGEGSTMGGLKTGGHWGPGVNTECHES